MTTYLVIYSDGGKLAIQDFPTLAGAFYWVQKHGGYIVKTVNIEEEKL